VVPGDDAPYQRTKTDCHPRYRRKREKSQTVFHMHLTTLRNCIIPAWSPERLRCGGAAVKRYSKESLIAGSVGDLTVSIQNVLYFVVPILIYRTFLKKPIKT
jgi:hypothetical protein